MPCPGEVQPVPTFCGFGGAEYGVLEHLEVYLCSTQEHAMGFSADIAMHWHHWL
jgi:hypothetical protein